jgi:glycosyltransferase involved in cell wall biosynthesis
LPLINFLVDKWLFLNEENATFVRNYVNKIKPYQIVKNGIELDKYLNKQNSMKVNNRSLTTSYCLLSTDRPRFLFIGRLEKVKGMEELLELIKAFPNFHFGFIGEGYYQKYLARFSNVQLYGSLNESEKITIMKQYNCLLFPSYQESFGLVILEALAVGLPVITTATNSNIPDLVRGNGIIVQVGDARGLVAAVREIAKQPIKIRTEYLNQYHWPNLIKTYLKAFNEV